MFSNDKYWLPYPSLYTPAKHFEKGPVFCSCNPDPYTVGALLLSFQKITYMYSQKGTERKAFLCEPGLLAF